MKKAIPLGLLVLIFTVGHAQQSGFPVLQGPYLGQKPPGMIPEIFAPGIISTELHDDGPPAFSPDGNEVFFRVVGHIDGKPRGIIFHMRRANGTWTRPEPAPFSGKVMDGGVQFSPDGNRLYLVSQRSDAEGSAESKINRVWVIDRKGDGWAEPRIWNVPLNRFDAGAGFSIAANGNVYAAVKTSEAEKEENLYLMRFVGGTYSGLENLGAPLNTEGWEGAPCIAPDESYLVFTAIRGSELGLYVSFRKNGKSWAESVRLNEDVNLGGSMFAGLSPDARYMFFVGHRKTERTNPKKLWSTEIFRGSQVDWGGDVYWVDARVLSLPAVQQTTSEMAPEIFAPGVISKDGIQTKLTMSADGSQILYCERDPATNAMTFISWHRAGDSWGEPVVLPFSREYMNMEPSLSADGTKVVFVSNRPRSGTGEPEKMPDIWIAEKSGNGWGTPVRLGSPVNTDEPSDIEAHPFFDQKGGLYFIRQSGKTRRLFHAPRNGDRFEEPQPVPLKDDLLQGQLSGPSLSPDGRILLMHSRKEGGFGGWDLYASFKDEKGDWSAFVNIGPSVNTARPEADAFFSRDGQYVFFSREGDVYRLAAKMIDAVRK